MGNLGRILASGAVLFGVACGGGGEDPPPIDDPPGPGEITVTVEFAGTAMEGVEVAFNNPDGSYVSSAETDANGQVVATVEHGSIVTVAPFSPPAGAPLNAIIQTIYGVNPGDSFIVDPLAMPVISNDVLTGADVTVPAVFEGAASYYMDSPCHSGAVTAGELVEFDVTEGCTGSDGKFDVIVYARDGGGNDIAFSMRKNITPLNVTTAVTMPNWSTTFDDYELTLSNYPPGAPIAIGVMVPMIARAQSGYFDTNLFSPTPVHLASGWPDSALLQYAAGWNSPPTDVVFRLQNVAPITDDFDFDVAANLAGRLIGTHMETPAGNRQPHMQLFPTGDHASIDGGVVCISWEEPVLGGSNDGQWWFVVAGGTTEIVAPDLPSSFNAYLPSDEAFFLGMPTATFIGNTSLENYDAYRNQINTRGISLLAALNYGDLSSIGTADIVLHSVEGSNCASGL